MLENELTRLKYLVNRLIESVGKKVDSLTYLSGAELIKSEKILTDMLKKLVGLTIDIKKSLGDKNEAANLSEEDEKIIEQFYRNYHIKIDDDKK